MGILVFDEGIVVVSGVSAFGAKHWGQLRYSKNIAILHTSRCLGLLPGTPEDLGGSVAHVALVK